MEAPLLGIFLPVSLEVSISIAAPDCLKRILKNGNRSNSRTCGTLMVQQEGRA